MVLAVIGSEELYGQVAKLNFRGDLDIRHIGPAAPAALCRQLEGDQEYTDVLLDIASVKGTNTDDAAAAVDRLLHTTQLHIMVLLDGYSPDSRLVRDLLSLGVQEQDIFLQAGLSLKIAMSRLLRAERAGRREAPAPSPAAEVTPPSQVDAAVGKAMQIKKPARPASRAVTVAVAGSCARIGVTTQAMQLLHYLRAKGYACAFVDMRQSGQMDQYLDVYDAAKRIGSHEFEVQGCHFIGTGKLLMQARAEYDYLICDYGRYGEIADMVSFWEKDIKVLVTGIKPWESELAQVFEDDDGSLHYIFSFVPRSDEADVLAQMGGSAAMTHFAPFAPDYFSFCGSEEIYEKILSCRPAAPEQKKKPFFKLFAHPRRRNR